MRELINVEGAPAAVGPYSHAVRASGLLWISGQIGLDPESGALVAGGTAPEAKQALKNLVTLLRGADSSVEQVVKTTIYLVDMADFSVVNEIYGEVFGASPPARACVAVAALPKGARVEFEAVALS
jgi:2-iminobutanoate/2-iminopropanoate deaminase